MVINANTLPLDALAIVVTFGVGFLLWTLAHLFLESHAAGDKGRLPLDSRPRR